MMWLLIMMVLNNSTVNLSYIYYEEQLSCTRAAQEFESHKSKDYKLKAFCIKGD